MSYFIDCLLLCVFTMTVYSYQLPNEEALRCLNAATFVLLDQQMQERCLAYLDQKIAKPTKQTTSSNDKQHKYSGVSSALVSTLSHLKGDRIRYYFATAYQPLDSMQHHVDIDSLRDDRSDDIMKATLSVSINLANDQDRAKIKKYVTIFPADMYSEQDDIKTTMRIGTLKSKGYETFTIDITTSVRHWMAVDRLGPLDDPFFQKFILTKERDNDTCQVDGQMSDAKGEFPVIGYCFEQAPDIQMWVKVELKTPFSTKRYMMSNDGTPAIKDKCHVDENNHAIAPENGCCVFKEKEDETDMTSYTCLGTCQINALGFPGCCVMHYPNPYYYAHYGDNVTKVFEIPNINPMLQCWCKAI